jgi:hypothetical protein
MQRTMVIHHSHVSKVLIILLVIKIEMEDNEHDAEAEQICEEEVTESRRRFTFNDLI